MLGFAMGLTLISHIWNEEFLLPYWLRHHYPLFDHGILLDYGSTDRSLEIIRELAPTWEIRPSRNSSFDAQDCDAEVMEVEREFTGWKMVLNATEFVLCADLRLFVQSLEEHRPEVMGVWAFDCKMVDPLNEGEREVTEAPLYVQKRWGYHSGGERSRLLHRHPHAQYDAGRHNCPLTRKTSLDEKLFVLWFGWSPMRYVRQRKLQIKERISARDRAEGRGRQHLVSPEELEAKYQCEAARAVDLWEAFPACGRIIQSLVCSD